MGYELGRRKSYQNITGKNNPNYRTGLACKGARSGLYNSWCAMKNRCLNTKTPKYKNYGGRGISICSEWLDIKNFYEWSISNGWKQSLQIDRIDNDGNYEPSNCRWVTQSMNSRKKRTTKISFDQAQEIRKRVAEGEAISDLSREYKVVHGTIWFIVKNFTHVAEGECTKKIKEHKESRIK